MGRMRDLYTQRHIVRMEDNFYTVRLVIGLVVLLDWLFYWTGCSNHKERTASVGIREVQITLESSSDVGVVI